MIVTPRPILEQWIVEMKRYAPSLTLFHYQGCKLYNTKQMEAIKNCYDVVITSYDVLSKELHYAESIEYGKALRYRFNLKSKASSQVQARLSAC